MVSLLGIKKVHTSVTSCKQPGNLLPGLEYQLARRAGVSKITPFMIRFSQASTPPLPFFDSRDPYHSLAKLTDRPVDFTRLRRAFPSHLDSQIREPTHSPLINRRAFELYCSATAGYCAQVDSELIANYLQPYSVRLHEADYLLCMKTAIDR